MSQNKPLEDFTEFLGMMNFDCSGDRLNYRMDGNRMVFTDHSIEKAYQAFRSVYAKGYRLGRVKMVEDINLLISEKGGVK